MSQSAKEMLRWIPPYYSESTIYKEQNTSKGIEFDILKFIISNMKYQFMPKYATWGLSFWEMLCGISQDTSSSFEDRRNRVITALSTVVPLTPTEFKEQIKKVATEDETIKVYYTDWNVDISKGIQNAYLRRIDPASDKSYILDMEISTFNIIPEKIDDMLATIREVIPAHLKYVIKLISNKSTQIYVGFALQGGNDTTMQVVGISPNDYTWLIDEMGGYLINENGLILFDE